MQSWELEKLAAAEMDEFSHRKINGKNFALWVLHQAKGKLRKHFSRDEIDGFKGIIHKTDLTLGIGRDGINSSECDIFSLKTRHCPDFNETVGTDFAHMRFVESLGDGGLAGYKRPLSNLEIQSQLPDPGELQLPKPPVMPN
jgi:hypothetical protein